MSEWEIEDKQGDLYEQLQNVKENQAKKDTAEAKEKAKIKELRDKTRADAARIIKEDNCGKDGNKTRAQGCPCSGGEGVYNKHGNCCSSTELENGECKDEFIGGRRKKTRRKIKRKRTKKKKRKRKRTKKKKSHRKNALTRKDKCSPKKNGERLEFTCYTKKALNDMKDLWNARHPDGKIMATQPRMIWEALGENMKNTCNRESCWMKQKWISNKLDKKIKKNTFAPTQPSVWKKKPDEWLTSIDILNVMKQYEDNDDDFEFLGPSPIDFDSHKMRGECVWDELCKFSLKKQKESGKSKIGIIFNLDPHDKPGSHWVAAYIDMKKKEIYYFDSYGDRTPSKIKTLVKRVQEESKRFGKKYKFKVNKKRHQYSDSECGMYCLHFVIELTKGTSFQKFQNVRFTDDLMTKLRNIYFNKI
jgi:hypothetical protein